MNNQKRRFRPRQQRNGFRRRPNSSGANNNSSFQNNSVNRSFARNGSMSNPFNVEKTIQKFQQLAKDSLSAGDPVLYENYLQHADHYSRRLSELNIRTKEPVLVKDENKKDSEIKDDDQKIINTNHIINYIR